MVKITVEGDSMTGKTSVIIPAIKKILSEKYKIEEFTNLSTEKGIIEHCRKNNIDIAIIEK